MINNPQGLAQEAPTRLSATGTATSPLPLAQAQARPRGPEIGTVTSRRDGSTDVGGCLFPWSTDAIAKAGLFWMVTDLPDQEFPSGAIPMTTACELPLPLQER
ncbi:hypothetical protein CC1G_12232 [Coprinopsis cinerea okayama7|uniref:Uncharacterized protein n=1 Tax=Coprinopsis cinerea (strain Okayama-7 / 130 / ATCC MYA-4618 / FGSC 9003) TaxID=240176 RepID=A8P1V6_COPC7|nr:hypothetical protein CC1G_12232 [Coprinopsis cinerea okayama7\|eukprot:XP_001838183.2 hypothetical protein CC1G_12232 [Coprinopsis cinerea okayama7\